MKRFKKCISLLLVAVMMVSMFVIPGGNVQAAKKTNNTKLKNDFYHDSNVSVTGWSCY